MRAPMLSTNHQFIRQIPAFRGFACAAKVLRGDGFVLSYEMAVQLSMDVFALS